MSKGRIQQTYLINVTHQINYSPLTLKSRTAFNNKLKLYKTNWQIQRGTLVICLQLLGIILANRADKKPHVTRHLQPQVQGRKHRSVPNHGGCTRYWLGALFLPKLKKNFCDSWTFRKFMSGFVLRNPDVGVLETDQNRAAWQRSSCEQRHDILAYCCLFLHHDCKYRPKFYTRDSVLIRSLYDLCPFNWTGLLCYPGYYCKPDCNEILAVKAFEWFNFWCYKFFIGKYQLELDGWMGWWRKC